MSVFDDIDAVRSDVQALTDQLAAATAQHATDAAEIAALNATIADLTAKLSAGLGPASPASPGFDKPIPGTQTDATQTNVSYVNGERHVHVKPSTDGSTGYGVAERGYLAKLTPPVTPARRMKLSYEVMFPAGFNPYNGGKLPSLFWQTDTRPLYGKDGMSSARVYHPDSCWPGIMFVGPSEMQGTFPNRTYKGDANLDHIRFECYVYANEINGVAFDSTSVAAGTRWGFNVKLLAGLDQNPAATPTPSGTGTGVPLYGKRGVWHTIEEEVVTNDLGKVNGELRLWVDGVLGLNLKNIRWLADAYNSVPVNGLHLDTFFGGPTGNATAQDILFRNLAIT